MAKNLPRERKLRAEVEVLDRSRRRCCVCFALNRDEATKRGQIAHLDRNRNNSVADNLVFLCLPHHDEFDSITSQSKSLQIEEVRRYREALYEYLATAPRSAGERREDDRNHPLEVKRVARLSDAELSRAEAAAHICVEKRHWWSGDAPQLSNEAWQKHSGTIAPHLSDQAWLALRVAIEALDNIRTARALAVAASLEAVPIPDTTADALAPMLRDIKLGRAALAPFARDFLPEAGK